MFSNNTFFANQIAKNVILKLPVIRFVWYWVSDADEMEIEYRVRETYIYKKDNKKGSLFCTSVGEGQVMHELKSCMN